MKHNTTELWFFLVNRGRVKRVKLLNFLQSHLGFLKTYLMQFNIELS